MENKTSSPKINYVTFCKHCGIKLKLDSNDLLAKEFICPSCKYLNHLYSLETKNDPSFPKTENRNFSTISITCPFCHSQISPISKSKTSTGGYIFFTLFLVIAVVNFLYFLYLSSQYSTYYYFDFGHNLENQMTSSLSRFLIFLMISLLGFVFRAKYKQCPRCRIKIG